MPAASLKEPPAPEPDGRAITPSVVLQAIRPRTLTAAIAPVVVATALAAAHGTARWLAAAACLLSALLLQVATNLANDYYDHHRGADTHDRVGPQRVTQAGLVAPSTVKAWAFSTFAAAGLIGIYLATLGGWPILIVGVLSILSGWAYTGGPYPLGYHGLGELFVLIFFGFVATLGTYWVQAASLPPTLWLLAVPVGTLSTAILVVNNLRDRLTDERAGKRTLAVRLGGRAARIEYTALLGLAYAAPLALMLLGLARPWVLLPILSLPVAAGPLRLVLHADGAALNPALGGTAKLQLVFALFLAAGLLFSSARLELWPFSLRLAAPLQTAHGTLERRAGLLLRLRAADGSLGLGEATPLPSSGTETLEEAWSALAALARTPAVLESLILQPSPAALDAALDALPLLQAVPAARCALEQALLDLAARRAGVPLYAFLNPGGSGACDVAALLSGSGPEELAADAAAQVAAGFTTLKLKVAGRPLEEDLARLAAVRAVAPPSVRLRLDANGGWSELQAAAALDSLGRFAPELCEQPVAPGDLWSLRWVRALSLLPIAADESLADPAEREALLAGVRPAADVLVLKPPVLGGLWRALQLGLRARALGVGAYVTTLLDGAVGRAGAAHLAAALGGEHAHGLATGRLLAEDLAGEPAGAVLERGRLTLGAAPGLGVALASPALPGLVELVECPVARHARLTPDAPAVIDDTGVLDYAALDAKVRALEAGLRARGVVRGATVALLSEAVPDAVALFFAAARAGVAVAPLNTRLHPRELAALVERIEPALLLAWRPLSKLLPGAVPLDELAREEGTPGEVPAAPLDPSAVWTVLFTSGTTGAPKAAELTVAAHLASAEAARRHFSLDAGTRWICSLPLFHVGGLATAIRCALAGGAVVLQRRFDALATSRALDEGATHASLVATTLARTLDARGAAVAPASLRAILVGGGPVPPALLARATAAGFPVLQTYGLTEACSLVTCERPGEADGQSAGAPLPGFELRIVDQRGDAVAPGVEGAIEVRTPALLRGYRGDPAATGAVFHGGFLRTGDLGVADQRGRLRVLARRTDLIVSGGENVYPAEVEAVLLAHPSIAEAAVAAGPDGEWGEAVVALVAFAAGASPVAAEELRSFCRERLASFKVPRQVRTVSALPHNAAGKVDRAALRALLELRERPLPS